MKSNSLIEPFLRSMFVTDCRNVLYFFPWRAKGRGFVVTDPTFKDKFARIYQGFLLTSLVLICLMMLFVYINPLVLIFGFLAYTTLWKDFYERQVRRLTQSLPAAKGNYTDIAYGDATSEEDESSGEDQLFYSRPMMNIDYSTFQRKDPLIKLKIFLSRFQVEKERVLMGLLVGGSIVTVLYIILVVLPSYKP